MVERLAEARRQLEDRHAADPAGACLAALGPWPPGSRTINNPIAGMQNAFDAPQELYKARWLNIGDAARGWNESAGLSASS
jgi:hypothetical protein